MTTLFDKTGLPLWVYIVVIVVGSILLLATLAFLLRCWYIRRKAKQRREYEGLTGGPIRRVTLRRGRVVPTSQHLSLTGSMFGMRQFGMLADSESAMTGRKSPFEWWNTIMDRSQSRQDQMSQLETGSISTRPVSRATTLGGGGRREYLTSTPTLTPEKSKETLMRTWEVTLPSPPPSPSPTSTITTTTLMRPVNFSRSFSNRGASSPLTQRSQITLSRISERSPHQSMISTNNGPDSSPVAPQPAQNRVSYHSAINPLDNTPFPGQLARLHQGPGPTASVDTDMSTMIPRRKSTIMTPLVPPSHFSSPRPSYHDRRTSPPTSSQMQSPPPSNAADLVANTAAQLPIPEPAAYRPSASHLVDYEFPSSVHTQRVRDLVRGDTTNRPPTLTPKSRPPPAAPTDYWSTRPVRDFPGTSGGSAPSPSAAMGLHKTEPRGQSNEIMGVLTVSGKNSTKVLRKKSLR